MRWFIPKKQDQEIRSNVEPSSWTDFNAPLMENDGGVCIAEETCSAVAQAAQGDADEDIRAGRVKRFDDPDDLIASLKQPW